MVAVYYSMHCMICIHFGMNTISIMHTLSVNVPIVMLACLLLLLLLLVCSGVSSVVIDSDNSGNGAISCCIAIDDI
jgi:hypothetical protein